MRLLYPADPFSPRAADEIFAKEFEKARAAGISVSLFSFEEFQEGTFRPRPMPEENETILYRGWMLDITRYEQLAMAITRMDAIAHNSPKSYALCHYLPNWYEQLRDHTAETLFFPEDADIESTLRSNGWSGCFLKDHVKSLSTGSGSLITDLSLLPKVIAEMRGYRGLIEGGLCARKIEHYKPESERRYFVFHGTAYGSNGIVPEIVNIAAKRIESPFFSVDVATRLDGEPRIIELGDGQVSDLKHWTPKDFLQIFFSKDTL